MKIIQLISAVKYKLIAATVLAVGLSTFNSHAQVIRSKAPGDTLTYVLYNSDLNFDTRRTQVFDDKHTIDSMVNLLATKENKQYQVIYRKEGQQGKAITARDLRILDKTGIFQVMIAYNKPGYGDDTHPMYIISSK